MKMLRFSFWRKKKKRMVRIKSEKIRGRHVLDVLEVTPERPDSDGMDTFGGGTVNTLARMLRLGLPPNNNFLGRHQTLYMDVDKEDIKDVHKQGNKPPNTSLPMTMM